VVSSRFKFAVLINDCTAAIYKCSTDKLFNERKRDE
jgi:hypothetical protein